MTAQDVESTEAAILGALGDAVLVVGPDGTIAYQSRSVRDAFGYGDDELLGVDAAELVHADDRDAIDGLLGGLDPGSTDRAEWRIRDAEGTWRWAEVSITEPETGRIDGYVISVRDVTEEVHARWDRDELLNRITEAFFAVDAEWRVSHVNERAADLLGVDASAAIGSPLDEFFPEGVGSTFHEQYREAMETGDPRQFEAYYEPRDSWAAVSVYPSETGLSVFLEDVTDRKRTEMAVAKNEKALRDLHDVAADKGLAFEEKLVRLLDLGRDRLDLELGFLTRIEEDPDGEMVQRVVACQGDHELLVRGESCPLSDAYCQRTIETDGLMATRDPEDEWVPEVAYETFGLETYVGGKLLVDGEIYGTLCFADNVPREHPFRSDEEAFVELLVEWMAYELERERRETRLQQQNDRLDGFASMVSHDLRNPLTIAQGNLGLLRETDDPDRFDAGDSEHFEAVAESLDRMERLIDDMLWLAREGRDVASTDPMSLASVARDAWGFVSTDGSTLAVECDDDVTVEADRERLVQCFENLFRNSIDHGDDGTATVSVGTIPDGFYVADDGPGIPPEDRESVFDTGFTTDEEGTGFGLAIVERIADAHGWTVTVGEGETGGARFEFRHE